MYKLTNYKQIHVHLHMYNYIYSMVYSVKYNVLAQDIYIEVSWNEKNMIFQNTLSILQIILSLSWVYWDVNFKYLLYP